jgi:hypothetical protein
MITADQTDITLLVPHHQMSSARNPQSHTYPLDQETKEELMRPSRCGGDDDRGMRCAGDIHRAIHKRYKTPANIRGRDANIVVAIVELEEGWVNKADPAFWSELQEYNYGNKVLHVSRVIPADVYAGANAGQEVEMNPDGPIGMKAEGQYFTCTLLILVLTAGGLSVLEE